MSRSVPWRRKCPDKVSSRIERACRARIYLLRATGPTGFLLTADGDDRKFKVLLGDPHSCSCPVFVRERELCVHILWVLIKKFRVAKENTVVYQLGLVAREVGDVVRGLFTSNETNKATRNNKLSAETDCREKQSKKEITEDDVCPICQEELVDQTEPTAYCKYGCGNSIHIKCMKIWAEHQKSIGESMIKCPLCRVDFGSIEVIKTEYLKSCRNIQRPSIHTGTVCDECAVSPITGKCYRCTVCSNCHLCKECFASDSHPQHQFVFRQKVNQRWRPASKFQVIPPAAVNDLQSREITEDDYTLLQQLDGLTVNQVSVPGHILNSFPVERIPSDEHRLTTSDEKCGVCFHGYKPLQVVRRLPCKHEFHRYCVDSWLSSEHNTCPIDGQSIYSTFETEPSGSNHKHQSIRERNTTTKPRSLITKKLLSQQEHGFPRSFSLNGFGLNHRSVETFSEVCELGRRNSAPPVGQAVRQTESSSKQIRFDTSIVKGPSLSTEHIRKYGRHSSSDIRSRRCLGLTARNISKTFGTTNLSRNDISLSGKRISTCEFSNNHSFNDGVNSGKSPLSSTKHCSNLIRTSLTGLTSETSPNHVPIDI